MMELVKQYVGKNFQWSPQGGITFDVTVKDVRKVFGRVELLVTPVWGGYGEAWVQEHSLLRLTSEFQNV